MIGLFFNHFYNCFLSHEIFLVSQQSHLTDAKDFNGFDGSHFSPFKQRALLSPCVSTLEQCGTSPRYYSLTVRTCFYSYVNNFLRPKKIKKFKKKMLTYHSFNIKTFSLILYYQLTTTANKKSTFTELQSFLGKC
jgi:hypothetical protein